jgi:predicted nucleotidyltransferase component of viral defense system
MNQAIESMLANFPRNNWESQVNALREVIQDLTLLGLWRGKFFEHAAFYGGTALRTLHQLDRFSEDMDFSLIEPDPGFSLDPYFRYIEDELNSFGFTVTVMPKVKSPENQIHSAFLKADTITQVMVLDSSVVIPSTGPMIILKIKIEIDVNPPAFFQTEVRRLLLPIPFSVKAYTLPYLFAGKMHAILFRSWKQRVKGRDWYDLIWFIARKVPLDMRHLEERMRQTGNWTGSAPLTSFAITELYSERIDRLDIEQAKFDCRRFIQRPDVLDSWSKDFFKDLSPMILYQ